VILASAGDLFDFHQCRHLPLICNRGQVDVYAGTAESALRTILCGQGYLTPVCDGQQSLGGSYFVAQTSSEQNRLQHLELLARMDTSLALELGKHSPKLQRVGQRCQTPDRMPLVGALDPALPGLYLNVAHGSNGLARTPISAALLASLLNNTPPPLAANLRELVDPARWGRWR
jgi:tRNA 5-methylaminomethyl-2-thiouridine biosynthesis bifunctional protein